MNKVSSEVKKLIEEYVSAATEEDQEAAFQKLHSQREKEAVEAMQSNTPFGWYIHETPK